MPPVGVTTEDKRRVKATIEIFSTNVEDNMLSFYATFLSTFPNYLPMLTPLRGASADPDSLRRNEWIKSHGPRVGAILYSLADKIDDQEELKAIVKEFTSKSHHVKYDLKTEDYMNFLNTFVVNLKTVLASEIEKADVEAWLRFVNLLEKIINQALSSQHKPLLPQAGHAPLKKTTSVNIW